MSGKSEDALLIGKVEEKLLEEELAEEELERAVLDNIGLVYMVARRYASFENPLEDLVSLGKIGLLKAVKKFDKDKGTCFSTFAVYYIQGEIVSFLRDDGMIKVSRSAKQKLRELSLMRQELESSLGRSCTISELAEESQISVEEILSIYENSPTITSLEWAYDTADDRGGEMQEKIIDRVLLEELMQELDKNEQLLIHCRYYKNLSQMQTAKVMHLSQSKVSRVEQNVLQKMRRKAGMI